MRSFLFVPGDSERKLQKVANSDADALVLDLEDAVSEDQKAAARELVGEFLTSWRESGAERAVFVRINGVDSTHYEADIASLQGAVPTGILLPKVRCSNCVARADKDLGVIEQKSVSMPNSVQLVVMVSELPRSVLNMSQYDKAPERCSGYAWSGEDLAAMLGASDNRDGSGQYTMPYQLARSLTLLVAGAARVQAIDAVFSDFRNHDGLRAEAEAAARDGFGGKLAIHPDQVSIINEAFTPSAEAIEDAKAVIAAFEADQKIGVIGHNNKMMDLPNLIMARKVMERAKFAGKA